MWQEEMRSWRRCRFEVKPDVLRGGSLPPATWRAHSSSRLSQEQDASSHSWVRKGEGWCVGMWAKIVFSSWALPVTHISDLCIILDFDIPIWVLISRLCLNLAKPFQPPSIKDRLICLPKWPKFLGLLPCIPKTAKAFLRALPMPLATPAAGVMDSPSPSSITLSTSCFFSPGCLLLAHGIVSTSLAFDPHFQIGNKAAPTPFCLPLWHSSYWGTGTPSDICKAPTLFSSQIKSLSSVSERKEKKKSTSTLCSIS